MIRCLSRIQQFRTSSMFVPTFRPTPARVQQAAAYTARCIRSAPSYDLKYADMLRQKAQAKGLGLDELKQQAREEARSKQKEEAATLLASFKRTDAGLSRTKTGSDSPEGARTSNTRKDSSPVKPLSSILNLPKIMATPHTSSQISALWTAYHASRTKGTGRGYICASLSLESYQAMARVAKMYPVFVVPVPRESDVGESTGTAYEFFLLQWGFHPPPPDPSVPGANPFEPVMSGSSCNIPESSTVLFTPLQEYKLRSTFATPYLVLTFYTDLSQSHGIVLLRGEITPSSSSAAVRSGQEIPERFLLSQVDAQLLSMGLQKFYLWGDGTRDGDHDLAAEALLKQFHEEPEKFSWQDLLKSSNVIA